MKRYVLLMVNATLLTACASSGFQAKRFDSIAHYPYETPQVSVGMHMSDVARIWGEPARVQSAGRPEHGNQRWIYPDSSAYAKSQSRIIYFERGRVAGWETVK